MRINRKIVIGAILVSVAVGALSLAYGWYYRRYQWPIEIQKALLGRQVVEAKSLMDQEGYSAYGEGMFRWRYKIDKENKQLTILCRRQAIAVCKFSRTRQLSDGVTQTVTYSDGVLILEEVWS